MPKEIQYPGTSYGLADAAGIKGRFPMLLDEVAVPTFPILQLEQSPYNRESVPCSRWQEQAAGGAGIYSLVGVRAGLGVILEVRRIEIVNVYGAGLRVRAMFLDGTSYGLWTQVASGNLHSGAAEDPGVQPAVPFVQNVQSEAVSLTRNVGGPNSIAMTYAATGGRAEIIFPYGFFLNGDSALGRPALVLEPYTSVNIGISATFFCREWKPKG